MAFSSRFCDGAHKRRKRTKIKIKNLLNIIDILTIYFEDINKLCFYDSDMEIWNKRAIMPIMVSTTFGAWNKSKTR